MCEEWSGGGFVGVRTRVLNFCNSLQVRKWGVRGEGECM